MFDVTDEDEVSKRRVKRKLTDPKVSNGVLPFIIPCRKIETDTYSLIAAPQVIFRPIGLMLWGFTPETVIDEIRIDTIIQGDVSCVGNIPAEFFGTARTYEKLVEDFDKNGITPPAWITFKTVRVGEKVRITVRGKLSHALMLGKAVW